MNPLLIRVDEIEESAQPWEADLSREFLDDVLDGPPPTEFNADGASKVHAELTKMGRDVLARGSFTVPLAGQCKRCLKPLSLTTPVEFTLTYVPTDDDAVLARRRAKDDEARRKAKGAAADDAVKATFDLGLLDEEIYNGKEIDLAPALREQILLALPPSPLCKEDCKGLCPTCGADLNERECGHKQESIDPRWAALKGLQLDKDKQVKKE